MNLPPCCADHVASYAAIDETYPREGAALCCGTCRARLTYHDGTWSRAGTDDPDPQLTRFLEEDR